MAPFRGRPTAFQSIGGYSGLLQNVQLFVPPELKKTFYDVYRYMHGAYSYLVPTMLTTLTTFRSTTLESKLSSCQDNVINASANHSAGLLPTSVLSAEKNRAIKFVGRYLLGDKNRPIFYVTRPIYVGRYYRPIISADFCRSSDTGLIIRYCSVLYKVVLHQLYVCMLTGWSGNNARRSRCPVSV